MRAEQGTRRGARPPAADAYLLGAHGGAGAGTPRADLPDLLPAAAAPPRSPAGDADPRGRTR